VSNEQEIRQIVRDELKAMLLSMAKTTERMINDYDARELESHALRAVSRLAEREAEVLPHTWECAFRKGFRVECNCGVAQ